MRPVPAPRQPRNANSPTSSQIQRQARSGMGRACLPSWAALTEFKLPNYLVRHAGQVS